MKTLAFILTATILTLMVSHLFFYDRTKNNYIEITKLSNKLRELELELIEDQGEIRHLKNTSATRTHRALTTLDRTNENLERILRDLFIPNRCSESNETIKDKISSKK